MLQHGATDSNGGRGHAGPAGLDQTTIQKHACLRWEDAPAEVRAPEVCCTNNLLKGPLPGSSGLFWIAFRALPGSSGLFRTLLDCFPGSSVLIAYLGTKSSSTINLFNHFPHKATRVYWQTTTKPDICMHNIKIVRYGTRRRNNTKRRDEKHRNACMTQQYDEHNFQRKKSQDETMLFQSSLLPPTSTSPL